MHAFRGLLVFTQVFASPTPRDVQLGSDRVIEMANSYLILSYEIANSLAILMNILGHCLTGKSRYSSKMARTEQRLNPELAAKFRICHLTTSSLFDLEHDS